MGIILGCTRDTTFAAVRYLLAMPTTGLGARSVRPMPTSILSLMNSSHCIKRYGSLKAPDSKAEKLWLCLGVDVIQRVSDSVDVTPVKSRQFYW